MQPDPLLDDDSAPEAQVPRELRFSHHGETLRPLESEDDIRRAASLVVPRVPLAGETDSGPTGQTSVAGDKPVDVSQLTAEDIRE